jgi:hypothetical protein
VPRFHVALVVSTSGGHDHAGCHAATTRTELYSVDGATGWRVKARSQTLPARPLCCRRRSLYG